MKKAIKKSIVAREPMSAPTTPGVLSADDLQRLVRGGAESVKRITIE